MKSVSGNGTIIGDSSRDVIGGAGQYQPIASAPAKKIRHPKAAFSFRRNVLPPVIGIVVMVGVMAAINGQLIAAQLHYRFATTAISPAAVTAPANNEVVPAASATAPAVMPDPSAPSKVSIPTLNVNAPVIFEPSQEEAKVQLALRSGVVHFANTAKPGEPGNVVLFGHSSGQPWAPGDYKFVFTLLDRIQARDKIYVEYQGITYIYQVTNTEVVLPTNVGVLNTTDKPMLTVITCSPVGSSQKRLVVRAEQISPRPVSVTAQQPQSTPAAQPVKSSNGNATQQSQPKQLPDGAEISLWQAFRDLF